MITTTTQMLADFMLSHEAEFAESITDFDYLEQFAVVLAVNYNLRNGKPHPITEGCRAVGKERYYYYDNKLAHFKIKK